MRPVIAHQCNNGKMISTKSPKHNVTRKPVRLSNRVHPLM